MAAPDLTQRFTCFVQKQGTDDAGANAVGAPQSRLTIAAALADLAANYPAADGVNVIHIVGLGPGNYAEDVVLPPNTFINGSCDGEGEPTTLITVGTTGISLSSGWTADALAVGGLQNLRIRKSTGSPALDFTLPVPVSGNPSRTLTIQNVRHNLTSHLMEATSTADVFNVQRLIQDGANTDLIRQTGGTSNVDGITSAAPITIRDKTSFAASGVWQGVTTGAGAALTVQSVAAAGCTLRLTASQPRTLTITETAPGVVAMLADAVSVPIHASVTYGGTATSADLTLLDDAYAVAYTPAVPADWAAPVPATVQAALDAIAAGGGGGKINNYATAALAAGNVTLTSDARNYYVALTVTLAAAATGNVILSTATPPKQGDYLEIDADVSGMDATAILNFRNATAGGTILESFTGGGVNTGTISFVYTGAAWVLIQAVWGP